LEFFEDDLFQGRDLYDGCKLTFNYGFVTSFHYVLYDFYYELSCQF